MRILEDDILRVKSAANGQLFEIMATMVKFSKQVGKVNNFCPCPFHADAAPSMNVNLARGSIHCFGCNWTGDIIAFYEKFHGLTFEAAVRQLADRCGVTLTVPREEIKRIGLRKYLENRMTPKARIAPVDTTTAEPRASVQLPKYERIGKGPLPEVVERFLAQRRMPRELAIKWRMGYVLHYDMELIDEAGHPIIGKDGQPEIQRFRDRLILPVYYGDGIVYYQARTMIDGKPKFLNPKWTLKTKPVFNLEAAGACGWAVLNEGVFSAIAVSEAAGDRGFAGVCCLGKIPAEEQFAALAQAGVARLTILLEPDVADKEAMEVIDRAKGNIPVIEIGRLKRADPWDSTADEITNAIEKAVPKGVFTITARLLERQKKGSRSVR